MCAVGKMTSCQISFIPIGSENYLEEIKHVLDIIKNSGLEAQIGGMSTVVRGESSKVFQLVKDIYARMDGVCSFTLDVRLSNLCGCGK